MVTYVVVCTLQILSLPSKLFYKNKLTCKAMFPSSGPKDIPAIKFVGVEGHEEQDDTSPSFYNAHEATEVVKQVSVCVCVCVCVCE